MVDRDIVFEKINQIQNCLKRIHSKVSSPDTLDDLDIQDIVVLNLQRAIQSTIDLAAHVVRDESLGLPKDLRENFILLEKGNIITSEISQKLQHMVGFRNIAIHEYSDMELPILKKIISDHLGDFEDFYIQVLKCFGILPPSEGL
ncbi:MAG: hypothetical protein ACD_73C00044G0002 [uncultured bacterium]|nr:MAG: hypothetical protein ACD_73C00044G0002 [uncultured bacterium]